MNIAVGRKSITISPSGLELTGKLQDIAFLEDTLGIKNHGDSIVLVRNDSPESEIYEDFVLETRGNVEPSYLIDGREMLQWVKERIALCDMGEMANPPDVEKYIEAKLSGKT